MRQEVRTLLEHANAGDDGLRQEAVTQRALLGEMSTRVLDLPDPASVIQDYRSFLPPLLVIDLDAQE
jgi:hypothetical protein